MGSISHETIPQVFSSCQNRNQTLISIEEEPSEFYHDVRSNINLPHEFDPIMSSKNTSPIQNPMRRSSESDATSTNPSGAGPFWDTGANSNNYYRNIRSNGNFYHDLDSNTPRVYGGQKPRSTSETESIFTNASEARLLDERQNSSTANSSVNYQNLGLSLRASNYRDICLWIRHILLATSVILLTFSLGMFLYDQLNVVGKTEGKLSTNVETVVEAKVFQENTHKISKISGKLMSLNAPNNAVKPHIEDSDTTTSKPRKVKSAQDFQRLNLTRRLQVVDLVEDLPPLSTWKTNLNEMDAKAVKSLGVEGTVTEEWLELLLNNFKNISHLSLNIHGLCIGSKVKNRSTLKSLKLENVETLVIEKNQLCSLMTWVMTWEMPNIKHIEIHDADLSKLQFEALCKFMNANQRHLPILKIYRSLICSECNFPKNLESRVTITEPKKHDDSDYEDYSV